MNEKTEHIVLPAVFRWDLALPVIGFVVPAFFSGPQIVTGTVVNMLLVLYALHVPSKRIFFMCALPSMGALVNGLLFGPFTPFLVYFVPCIWLGNMILVHSVRAGAGMHWLGVVGISAFLKSVLLFLTAFIFVRLQLVPAAFLTAMGVLQLGTAIVGGGIAFGMHTAVCRK